MLRAQRTEAHRRLSSKTLLAWRTNRSLPYLSAPGIFPRIRRHPLLGSARLIVDWSTIAQGGMQPPVIVIAKIAAQREPQPPFRRKPRAVHELGLQGVKKRLHVCVVAWRADARRALPDPQRPQPVAERLGGILAAAIAVEDEPGPRPPASDRSIEDGAR